MFFNAQKHTLIIKQIYFQVNFEHLKCLHIEEGDKFVLLLSYQPAAAFVSSFQFVFRQEPINGLLLSFHPLRNGLFFAGVTTDGKPDAILSYLQLVFRTKE